jgi:hypothetical protein
MRRPFLISAVVTFCVTIILLSGGCKKREGVYKPKEKISKIYYEEIEADKVVVPKKLKETWTWEKKKLTKIELAERFTLNFSYDNKNRVSKIEGGKGLMKFYYEKKYLDKIEITADGMSITMTVSDRKDDKITKLTCETQSLGKSTKSAAAELAQLNPVINLFFSNAIANAVLSDISETKMHKAGTTTIVYEYTYSGNNITEIKETEGATETVFLYSYDDKKNPYYKSLYYLQGGESITGLSENNIVTYYEKGKRGYATNYRYEYNGEDLPISIALIDEVFVSGGKAERKKIEHIEYVQ